MSTHANTEDQSAKAPVRDTIMGMPDIGLPRAYPPELYQPKCGSLFEHICKSYGEMVKPAIILATLSANGEL